MKSARLVSSLLPAVLFIISFLMSGSLVSKPLVLEDPETEYWVGMPYMEFAPGITGLPSEGISRRFKPIEQDAQLILNNDSGGTWLRFSIRNNTHQFEGWLLEFLDINTEHIEVYEKQFDQLISLGSTGSNRPFSSRYLKHKNFEFPLDFSARNKVTYLVYVKSRHQNVIKPVIRTDKLFINYALQEYGWLGLYYGMLLLIIVFNVMFYLGLRSKAYLVHIGYVISVIFLSLSNDGLGFQYLWPDQPAWNDYIQSISMLFLEVGALGFTIAFFNTKQTAPAIHRTLLILIAGYFIRFSVAVFIHGIPIHQTVLDTVPMVAAFAVSVYFYFKKGFVPARYFMLAYTVLVIGFSVSLFERIGWIPSNAYTFYSMNMAIVLEVIFLSFALVHRIRTTAKEKEVAQDRLVQELKASEELKDRHNRELEQKVAERTVELHEQKLLVEEKNKDITASINYAQRIQNAILPDSTEFKRVFPDSFIFFQPRDIVSGDFYFMAQVKNKVVVAVIDCTGHGVPGGFMSMIGYSILNQSIFTHGIDVPGLILDHLNEGIIDGLKQRGITNPIKDGMDLVVMVIDPDQRSVRFSGANNNILYSKGGEIQVLKGDRQPIGDASKQHERFKTQELQLAEGDTIYATTDGFVDQFGGPKGGKYMTKRFKALLTEIAALPLAQQGQAMEKVFNEWKGEFEQVDDVTVLGIKI